MPTPKKPTLGFAKAPAKTLRTVIASRPRLGSARQPFEKMLNEELSLKARTVNLAEITDVLVDKDTFTGVLDVLGNPQNPPELRYTALSLLQAAAFDTQAFAEYRTIYINRLRRLRMDPDPEVRARVLGLLSREKDPTTQQMLMEGLADSEKALLPPEKALQLIAYDMHAGAYEVAQKIAKDPPNALARREALRILATSSEYVLYFEQMLRNKAEPAPMRQLAAQSLNQLAPDRLQLIARAMAVDEDEDIDVKSLSLTALTNFGDIRQLQQDTALQTHVAQLVSNPTYEGTPLQAAADSFKRRCGS